MAKEARGKKKTLQKLIETMPERMHAVKAVQQNIRVCDPFILVATFFFGQAVYDPNYSKLAETSVEQNNFFQIKHSLVLHTGSFATLHAIAAKLYWLLAGQDNSLIYKNVKHK